MKKKLLLFFAMLFCVLSTFAATFYVRTDGNDGNTGGSNSSGGAWKTVKYGVSQLNTGDILLINDGYYFEPDEIKLDGKVGSNTNRITIKAINRRAVKIESNSLYHAIAIVNCTGVTVEGLEITFQANTRSVFHGMNLDGSNRITVKDCWVHDAPFSGIQGSNSDNIIVENCLITDNCKGTQISENGSGISIAGSANRETNSGFHHILRNNIIYENEATSNVASTGSPTDGNGIIFDFNNENGANFTYQSLVENNLVYKNGGRAIHVFGSRNVTIRNNTCFYNNYILDQFGWYNGEIQVEGPGCSIYNNIAVQDPSLSSRMRAIKIFTPTPPPSQNNLFVGNIEGTLGSPNILYTTGSQANVNFVNASTNPAVANFRLQANSPAVNAGNNSFASATDILGVTRPSGGTVDMGCYEYVGATADTQAPTVPASLISASITQTSFTLNWAASTDASGINRYEIFRNGTSIGTSTTTSFNVTGLAANTSYSMSVSAFDNATPNNVSNQSAPLSVRTLQAPVSGNLGFESDFTSWVTYGSASITTTAANVRSGAKAGFFSNGGGNYTFTGLTPGATYSLRGWIKAASGTEIWITASNYGGANTGLSSSATSWTQTGNIIFTMGASNTTVTLATWTGATSSAYFDDFTVAPYTTPPAVATNIATSGDASIWSDIPSATSTSNATKSANTLINNGNTTAEVVYNDVNSAGNWQAAGIVWATAQKSITSIKLYHGEHLGGNDNGCFTANMKVQKTNDGTTWTDVSGWAVSPTYPYTAATSNQTYTLTGPKIVDARGVRIVGQVRTNDISWSIKVRELEVLGSATASLSAPSNSILKVARQEKSTVAVYPNPASNSFNVSAQSDNAKITISTLHGKVITIVNANAKVTTIDSGNWAAGMYLIQVQTGAQTTVKKVIIAK